MTESGEYGNPICHGEAYTEHRPTEMYETTEEIDGEETDVWYCSNCRRMVTLNG